MPSGKWRVRWRDESKRLRARSFDRKADADKWATHVTRARQLQELHLIDAGSTPLGKLAHECDVRRWQRREPVTRDRYARTWNLHINPYLGTTQVARITGATVEDWLARLERDGVSADGQRRALSLLRSIMNRGVEWGYVRTNQTVAVPMPEAEQKPAVRPLSPRQIEQIVDQLERPQDVQLVRLIAYAGLRPGEALALTTDHIRKQTLLIEQSNANGRIKTTKTKKVRSVDLLPPLATSLREWIVASGTRGLLFPRFDGKPWTEADYRNWCRRIFDPATKAAGVSATPYTLRHSFASLLIHAREPITYVAAQLGHSVSMCSDTYSHVIQDLARDAAFDPSKAVAEAMHG